MKERPKKTDPEIIDAAAELLVPELMKWADETENRDAYLKDAKKVIRDCYWKNGYELARDLDSYCPDSELVDILENASFHLARVLSAAIKAWVAENNIVSPFPMGAKVEFDHKGKVCLGEVATIYAERAEMTIYCAALGHVREGCGPHGLILPYDRVRLVA